MSVSPSTPPGTVSAVALIARRLAVFALPMLLPLMPTQLVASPTPSLEEGFANPPSSARPRVWWHWMNGNISKEGIQADIEWMARIGIGGLQNFDAALNTPQIVDERLVYMTPEWKDAFRLAAQQAAKHHLELAIAGSPGWSETGGPWVSPEDGMKKLVWSSMIIDGGQPFSGPLPPLPSVTGVFQDIAGGEPLSLAGSAHTIPQLAGDTVVLALPMMTQPLPLPTVRQTGGETLDALLLNDSRYNEAQAVTRGSADNPTTLEMIFNKPQVVRGLTLHIAGAVGPVGGATVAPVLEVANNDNTWHKLADMPVSTVPTTVSFAPVTAKRFRVLLHPNTTKSPIQQMGGVAPGVDALSMVSVFGSDAGQTAAALAGMGAKSYQITELALQSAAKVNAFELKAAFSVAEDYYALPQTGVTSADALAPEQIINLTGALTPDGSLDWTPPPGRWKVLRLGWSLTGKTNHPAPPEATGLEVDKFDGDAVRRYMQTYLSNYRAATGETLMGDQGLQALLTDSIEVGPSNWTPRLIEQFKRLRGYDPTPWLPTLTGTVVGSGKQSDAFLYDYRRTLSDLIASQHYAEIARVAEEFGLTYYSEAVESIRTTLGDDMAMRTAADIPMAAMWTYGDNGPNPSYTLDIRGAASVAHIYGQNLVAAESLTSVMQPWAHSPAQLRPMMDLIFAHGVNRPVIHTSVHQPADERFPGLALLIFGQYFNRHETWAEMAKPWVDYMARTSFLLQQGRNEAEVAYFYGEEAPLTMLFKDGLPHDAPAHYGFDFVNADAVHSALSVQNGELVAKGGARYRVLYLGGTSHFMTLPVLRRIAELVEAGATLIGLAPVSSPSLADDTAQFNALVQRLWGTNNAANSISDRRVGKGRVIESTAIEQVLALLNEVPDFDYDGSEPNSKILFQHRQLDTSDIYFLSNQTQVHERGEARFGVIGKIPEIWRADTGEKAPLSYRIVGGQTVIDLDIAPRDAFFVVFREPTQARSATFALPTWQKLADINGSWTVEFQAERGAPERIELASLLPLNEHPIDGVRYFSGTATYTNDFELPADVVTDQPLQLDLGAIGDVAEVFVNGKLAGTAWREPYRVDIGNHVQAGKNELTIRVANLWVNRLIGDVQPGATKVTWTSTPIYLPSAPLRPSGLMGPVTLFTQ